MKRRYRLLRKNDFQNVLKKGFRVYTKNFVCYYLEFLDLKNIKIGIIIPKKKCKLSHRRKYLKRVFWAFNSSSCLDVFPRIKCVVMYRDYFYTRFKDNVMEFKNLKEEYLGLMENIKNRVNR